MNTFWPLAGFSFYIACFAAWITAIVTTVKADDIAMLIIDIMIPPVGVIHGWLIWLF